MIQRVFSKLSSNQKLSTILVLFTFLLFFSIVLWDLLLPIIVALLLSYILMPVVDRLTVFLKIRFLSIFILYLFFIFILTGGLQFIVPPIVSEFNQLSINIPLYFEQTQLWFNTNLVQLQTEYPFLNNSDLITNFQTNIQSFIVSTFQTIPNIFFSTFSILTLLLFIPLLMFFFLYQGKDISKAFIKFIPNRYFEMFVKLFYSTGNQISSYISGIFIESVIIGFLTTMMLIFLKSDYTVLLGTIAGIANIIPYIGPIIAAIPAIIIFYLKIGTVEAALFISLGYIFVQSIDNIILKPVIFSRTVNLHPLIVFLGLLVGGMLGDMWGLILAVPVMGSIKVSLEIILKELNFRLNLK
ncbi:MAG: hypothetical protein CMP39_00180 [Rickettsiales bacterium]|nr:hypothetical protein [Rickettsiales bacterium]